MPRPDNFLDLSEAATLASRTRQSQHYAVSEDLADIARRSRRVLANKPGRPEFPFRLLHP